ncbi:hypothetical protein SAMN04487975_1047 [Planococcus glaciei]|uniref:hypothetical protein n=1 Tax=Planococcus glaciei TaxID=459472 RepID=UPI00088611E7|nr:hypothetical protein [Planococcus glaciei]SDH31155.1 hypothetical protein SAMN04487975_1047 [Planococcus glaciei]
MGIFDIFKGKSWEEKNAYTGDTPPCPRCGEALTKKYEYSDTYCTNCNFGLDDDDDSSESLSVYEAAEIWVSNGKDEDYMFGYTEKELENAL